MANVVVVSEAQRLAGTTGPRLPVLPLDRRLPATHVPEQPGAVTDAMLAVLNRACGSGACGSMKPAPALIRMPLRGQVSKGDLGQMTGRLDGSAVEGAARKDETADAELASMLGGIPGVTPDLSHIFGGHACTQAPAAFSSLDAIQPEGPNATAAAADGRGSVTVEVAAEEGAQAKKTAAQACAISGAALPPCDDRAELHALGGPSMSLGTQAFDMFQPERAQERQTVLTQSSQERAATLMDSDTLRFTYHFRSWQGQPGVVVSLNLHEQGRKLRVEAPDRAVFAALLANRDAFPGVLKIADNEPGSSGREGREGRPQEPGE
jgi:hypothetical protein